MNVSYPHDILLCSLEQLHFLKKDSIIGKNCKINNGVRVDESIIGDRVNVREPIHIKESLIFSDTSVDTSEDLERCILDGKTFIDCKYFF
jgi:ADP-glucose pyrophosphorylase